MSDQKLVVAVSSRTLFDLDESHRIFEQQGIDAYCQYQIEQENEVLEKGVAFELVRKLLNLNSLSPDNPLVEVILLSRNSADTGLRVFNSIKHYQLDISRAAFTSGDSPYRYVSAFQSHLFLSTVADDVKQALRAGIAAATIIAGKPRQQDSDQLRIAFDGDAVLFSDEAEQVYQSKGLDAFNASEVASANQPLAGGPFKKFLQALHRIQTLGGTEKPYIRTALVTARAAPAHERVVKTLRSWGIRIDEALFLGGMNKGEFVRSFGADIFFDDQQLHIDSVADHSATGHVPDGINNTTPAIP